MCADSLLVDYDVQTVLLHSAAPDDVTAVVCIAAQLRHCNIPSPSTGLTPLQSRSADAGVGGFYMHNHTVDEQSVEFDKLHSRIICVLAEVDLVTGPCLCEHVIVAPSDA